MLGESEPRKVALLEGGELQAAAACVPGLIPGLQGGKGRQAGAVRVFRENRNSLHSALTLPELVALQLTELLNFDPPPCLP